MSEIIQDQRKLDTTQRDRQCAQVCTEDVGIPIGIETHEGLCFVQTATVGTRSAVSVKAPIATPTSQDGTPLSQ
jgi:hypothetical protein